MNPEFQRNLWLEATPRRLGLIAVILLLAFFAADASPFDAMKPYQVARLAYFFIVVGWGTRNAALAVVSEIRDRTWDAQRLSSQGPFGMTWGKLFGATAANWFGGLLCLGAIMPYAVIQSGAAAAIDDVASLLLMGVFSQAVAFLASLMLVRRRQAQSRLDTFLCQIAGIAVVLPYYSGAAALASARRYGSPLTLHWWSYDFGTQAFLLASLAIFTAWALIGCYRMMRLELRMPNGPFVWLAYLVFACVYSAGFDFWLMGGSQWHSQVLDFTPALRLGMAGLSLLSSTYAMALLEPKDPVRLRWLAEQARALRLGKVFMALDGWMMSYAALVIVTLVLAFVTRQDALAAVAAGLSPAPGALQAFIPALAGLGFVTRDMAIFVLMGGSRKRGELAVLAVLAALYILAPAIFGTADKASLILFYPRINPPAPAGILIAWAQAAAVIGWAAWRLHRRTAA